MCGISGFLDLETGVDTDVLQRMTAVIRHRGPDDEGYALIGRKGTDFYGGADTLPQLALPPLKGCAPAETFLGLGHRRLSILDLSAAGHQPMFLPERDLVLTYNGEIYNYLELRDQLGSLGYRFRTACDTEVLLYAYCQWRGLSLAFQWDVGLCPVGRTGTKALLRPGPAGRQAVPLLPEGKPAALRF